MFPPDSHNQAENGGGGNRTRELFPSESLAYDVSRCENCHRERLTSDLFWHRDDKAWYCQDVLRCQARFEIRADRGDFYGWPTSDKAGAHVALPDGVRSGGGRA